MRVLFVPLLNTRVFPVKIPVTVVLRAAVLDPVIPPQRVEKLKIVVLVHDSSSRNVFLANDVVHQSLTSYMVSLYFSILKKLTI